MGTRSFIGIQNENGSITAIYCHWSGYPSFNGHMLFGYWSDPTKIRELMALGSVSELGKEIGERHDWEAHNLLHPDHKPEYYDWCLSYNRDRGDTEVEARTYNGIDHFLRWADKYDAEFAYLFEAASDEWYIYPACQRKRREALKEVLKTTKSEVIEQHLVVSSQV